ncbi:uncharacterized protein LOC115901777 [Camarhynchus parvulus]|uniref:uncharacterized protein LOC115901777 n=1 Tax=Geospiza parvula TaxID=87175 RepID=UPI001237D15D|nr:uncharacterized protein LOC115901777 [Camarhynchus parvulus]
MRRPTPTLSITRVCFGSPLPFPPLGTLTATHPSTPALRLSGGCLRSCSQVQCGPRADTGLAPQAQALSLASGACHTGHPPPRPRAGVTGHSGSLPVASPRHPGRSPPVPVPRRSALRRPSAGQPPAERPAKGSPKAGWDWSGADDRAQTAERREERAEPTGIHLQQQESVASIANFLRGSPQPCRALPSGRAERDRGRRRADAPRRPSARPEPPGFGHPATELLCRDSRAPSTVSAGNRPSSFITWAAGAARAWRPCPHPERRRSPGRGLRCPAAASPRPAAAVGACPARGGGSARAARAPGRQELPRGTRGADRQRGDTSGARLRGTGARRSACPPRHDSAPGAPAPQPPGRGAGNRSPQAQDASPRPSPPPAGGEAAAALVPTQAGPPPCRWQQILLSAAGSPRRQGGRCPAAGMERTPPPPLQILAENMFVLPLPAGHPKSRRFCFAPLPSRRSDLHAVRCHSRCCITGSRCRWESSSNYRSLPISVQN